MREPRHLALFAVGATRGVTLPDPLPDPWLNNIAIDSDTKEELHRLTEELKPYDGLKGGDLQKMLVEYLRAHVEILRQRKGGNDCA
jgi:hypothetical protein